MDTRLVAWTVVLTVSVVAARVFPPAALAVSLLAPLLALLWAWSRGVGAALAAVAPAAALLAWLGPRGLPVFAASVLAGVIMARVAMGRATGRAAARAGATPSARPSIGAAVAAGTLPFAAWTVALALSGFDPVSEELVGRWEQWAAAAGGVAGGEEFRRSADAAMAILRNTWVASEVLWFAGLLAIVAAVARRTAAGSGFPAPGRWKWMDLPDALVGVLIAGLLLVLVGGGDAVRAAGWNLVFGSAVLYALRGIGIEIFWLDRGRVGRGMRTVFFLGNIVLFLPVFLVLSAVLGLLDTWFDFRHTRGSERGGNPLSLFHHSSGDDLKE